MGKSYKPKYIILVSEGNGKAVHTPMTWPKEMGQPTDAKLSNWVETYNASLKIGGANEHLSKALGYMPILNSAWVVTNDRNRYTLATWKAPMFMVI